MKTLLILLLLTIHAFGEFGVASHYSIKSNGGTTTASGVKLCDNSMVAAHKSLPFGSVVKVTDLKSMKSVNVTIVDRGPYIAGRIIDMSQAAAKALGFHKKGITRVKLEVVSRGKKKLKNKK